MQKIATLKNKVLMTALLAMPFTGNAAGLGKITVLSSLGQPLLAEIDLLSNTGEDLSTFDVRMANAEAYQAAKIEYPSHLAGLRVSIEKRTNGRPYIRVSSPQAVNEPFVDMLLELNWSSGKMVKEFTALLDPVDYQKASNSTKTSTSPVNLPTTGKKKGRKSRKVSTDTVATDDFRSNIPLDEKLLKPKKDKPTEKAPEPNNAVGEDEHQVKRGETLSSVAAKMRSGDVSLEQMLVGLYRNNASAFDGGNMNRLKVGAILKAPSSTELQSISKADAAKEIRLQAANWHTYREKLAGSVASKPAESKTNSTTKIQTKIDTQPVTPANTKDQVKLTKGDIAKPGQDDKKIKSLQEKISAMEDDALVKDKAVVQANTRVAELEKLNKELRELLIKNKAAAELQKLTEKNAQDKKAAADKAAADKLLADKVAADKVAADKAAADKLAADKLLADKLAAEKLLAEKIAADKKASETAASTESVASEQVASEAAVSTEVVASVAKPAAKPKKVIVSEPAPVEEDFIGDNMVAIGGGAAGLLALIVGFVMFRRRRNTPTFEDSIITGSDLRANTNIGNTGGAIINTSSTENSFLTDFSREGLGAIDTDEVDPIAEAEVYLAYGRDPQAEEILKDALVKDPARQEVRLKLLEIYATRKDNISFETHSSHLFGATQGQGPIWAQVVSLGRTIDPNNPLYAKPDSEKTAAFAAPAVAAAPTVSEDMGLDLDLTAAIPAYKAPAPVAAAEELDFDLGAPALETTSTPAPAAPVAEPDTGMLDFNLDSLSSETTSATSTQEADMSFEVDPVVTAAPTEMSTGEVGGMLDFNFDLDESAESSIGSESFSSKNDSPLDLSGISLDLDDAQTSDLDAMSMDSGFNMEDEDLDDPVATKLDLAKAYIEMGDEEGAREILSEVETEGQPDQQAEARKLLKSL